MNMWSLCIFALSSVILQESSCLLPQVSQEGRLRPYRSYSDVTLFHYFVPNEVTRATFEFAALMDNSNCQSRDVYIFLQHGSYPVFSADNATFPPNMWVHRSSIFNIILHSSFQPHDATVFPVYNPLPGSWFAAAFLANWDQNVQQEGIGHKCQYSLGSIALWSQLSNVDTIPIKTKSRLSNMEHFTYYKFYIPTGTWSFTITIDGCRFRASHLFPEIQETVQPSHNRTKSQVPCVHNVFLRARALPRYNPDNNNTSITNEEGSKFVHVENLPHTDSYYYLLVVSETKVLYNVTIAVKDCPVQILGKNFIQHFAGLTTAANMKEQALRTNPSLLKLNETENNTCECVPVFRLTRIKHAQDFSDTFLLEGKEWFTTWLALSDTIPVATSFELLPYVDIGGTLRISIHLDELLLNATMQTLHVTACVRKSQPPQQLCCKFESGNFSDCCDSGLVLQVSSSNLHDVGAHVLIPYPEPDVWFISFKTYCTYKGNVVPCAVEEALISLDIRTQPCVLAKPDVQSSSLMPCGTYGVCQEVHKGQFFYTCCRCIGGYRGWACTDDSEATPDHILLLSTLLLTLSNLFFIPAIVLAIRRKMLTQALIYLTTMISSSLYHACDQEIYGYCLTRYQVLQFCDFFSSILAFWVTLIALGRSPPKYESVLYMLGAILIAIGVEYNRTGLLVFIVPFALGIGIPLTIWTFRSYKNRSLIKPKLQTMLLFLPGLFLGAAGLILFAFVETEDNYRYTHSAWHVIIAISLLYLLPKNVHRPSTDPVASVRLEVNQSSELSGVNDYSQASPSPVFFITSELDHLVHEPSR